MKYQPKHLKKTNHIKLPRIACKPFIAAGLTGVMVAQTALTPVTAIAANLGADGGATVDVEQGTVDTGFASEAQRLIGLAGKVSSMSVDEAKQLLAQAEDLLNKAQAAHDQAVGADQQAQKAFDTAQQTVTTNQVQVTEADKAAENELQAQVDALQQQLTDAKAQVEALEQQKEGAERQKSDLESQKADAEAKQAELQKALDEANDAMKKAQDALDALGEAPTADEQAAYDEAKKAYDDAVANQAAKQQVLADAQSKLDGLNAQLAEQKGNLDAANADLAGKKQAVDDAESKLDEARGNYQSAIEAIKSQIVSDAENALNAAKSDLAAKQGVIAGLEQAVTDAQGNLDAANAAVPGAQSAYDAAKAEADSAQAAANAAKRAADAASAKAVDAAGALEGVSEDDPSYAGLKQAADVAQIEYQQAYGAYQSAQATADTKAGAAAGAKSALDQANAAVTAAQGKLDQANANLAFGKQAVIDAAGAVSTAQSAYDSVLETAGSQAEAEAQAAIDEAQAVYDQAVKTRDETQKVIDEAPGKIKDLEAQIETEQVKVTDAQKKADTAATDVADAEAALDDAEVKLDKLKDEQAAWDEKAAPLKQAVADAENEVDAAKADKDAADNAVSDLETKIADVEKQIDDLRTQAGDAQTQAVDSLADFMVWLRKKTYDPETNTSDCSAALGCLATAAGNGAGWGLNPSGDIETYTHLDDPTDATAIDNVLKALDMVDQMNALRKSEGLNELDVSLMAMVEAAFHANWSAETGTCDHAVNEGYSQSWGGNWGENAAWGYTAEDGPNDFFTGWYYQEKANYTKQSQTDPTTGKVYTPEKDGQTGHYTNIISSGKKYTGMAYRDGGETRYPTTAVNVFGTSDVITVWNPLSGQYMYYSLHDKTFTTSQLRDLIRQAQAEGVVLYHFTDDGGVAYDSSDGDGSGSAIQDKIYELTEQLKGLNGQLETAKTTASDKQAAYDDAVKAKTQADEDLAAIGGRPTDASLQQAVKDAQAALDQAKADKATADENLKQVKADAQTKLAALEDERGDLSVELGLAQAQIDSLNRHASTALEKLNQAKAENLAVIDAGDTYRAAKANLAEATDAYYAAQKTVDGLSQAVADTETKVAEAEKAVDAAKAAHDAAGPTDEQAEALKNAEATLKAATDKLNELTEARDAAQVTAEKAQAAVDANGTLVAELAFEIAEQDGLIDAVDAKLPGAEAKADAWAAVFEQQTVEDIVKNGFSGTVTDADIAGTLAGAHGAYAEKLAELAAAKAKLDTANEALEKAKVDKTTTAQDLVEAIAEQALAQEAYDKIKAEVDSLISKQQPVEGPAQDGENAPVQQAAMKTAKAADNGGIPQTGDPAAVWATSLAIAGLVSVAGGAHFRRRRDD